jgi:endo-1,4-beta-mannosidase
VATQSWVGEMSAFFKSMNSKQMVTVGDEGFATFINNQDDSDLVNSNPGSWADFTGVGAAVLCCAVPRCALDTLTGFLERL